MHKIEYILNCISNESKDDKKIQQQEKKLFKLEILLSEISASADGGPRSRVCTSGTLRSAPHRH